MVMEGLLLKLINSNEEKLTEFYEIICRILNINDPEHLGFELVCEKFSKKSFVHKVSKLLNSTMIAALKERFFNHQHKKHAAFWRDNLLLEILRMNKENLAVNLLKISIFCLPF